MNEDNKGLWFCFLIKESFGLSLAIVYTPESHDIQIAGMVGWLLLAVGYTF